MLLEQSHNLQSKPDEVKMIVEIGNIKYVDKQKLYIAVDRKSEYLSDKPFQYTISTPTNNSVSVEFYLPKGAYAVSVYQDLNDNAKLDKNFFGAPTEPFAFSRNYKPTVRSPRFDEVKIEMSSDRKIGITMILP